MARTLRKVSENNYGKKTFTTTRRKARLKLFFILCAIGSVLCGVNADGEGNTGQPAAKDKESLSQNENLVKSKTVSTATHSGSTLTTTERPPEPQGVSRENNSTKTVLSSIIYITVIVTISVIGVLAIIGGMLCWYKHASIMSASRRVFYRSSDASVLIHNDYQTMPDSGDGGGVINAKGNRNLSLSEIPNRDLARLAEKTDYPAYGVTGPNPLYYSSNGPPIDTNLNRNAEVYHYHQQKQKLKALESASSEGSKSQQTTSETLNDTSETTEGDEENSDGEYTVYECPGLASTTDGPLEIHNPLFADIDTYNSYGTSLGLTPSQYNYGATLTNQS